MRPAGFRARVKHGVLVVRGQKILISSGLGRENIDLQSPRDIKYRFLLVNTLIFIGPGTEAIDFRGPGRENIDL